MEHEVPEKLQLIGFLVKNDREKIEQKMPEKLAEYDRLTSSKKYSALAFYPLNESLKFQHIAALMIYGNDSPEAYHKLGRWDYRMIMDSQYGKTVFNLFFKTPKDVFMSFPHLVNSVFRGLHAESIDKGEHMVEIILDVNPYPEPFMVGFFEECLERNFKKMGTIIPQSLPDGKTKYTICWV